MGVQPKSPEEPGPTAVLLASVVANICLSVGHVTTVTLSQGLSGPLLLDLRLSAIGPISLPTDGYNPLWPFACLKWIQQTTLLASFQEDVCWGYQSTHQSPLTSTAPLPCWSFTHIVTAIFHVALCSFEVLPLRFTTWGGSQRSRGLCRTFPITPAHDQACQGKCQAGLNWFSDAVQSFNLNRLNIISVESLMSTKVFCSIGGRGGAHRESRTILEVHHWLRGIRNLSTLFQHKCCVCWQGASYSPTQIRGVEREGAGEEWSHGV